LLACELVSPGSQILVSAEKFGLHITAVLIADAWMPEMGGFARDIELATCGNRRIANGGR
jgi:hypothetical protein